jgi:hypothetical protein
MTMTESDIKLARMVREQTIKECAGLIRMMAARYANASWHASPALTMAESAILGLLDEGTGDE